MLTTAKSYLLAMILLRNWCNLTDSARPSNLTAISSDPYVVQLYQERGVPSQTDEAISDPRVRESICRSIDDTGYSMIHSLVKSDEIHQNRFAHPDIFNQIFTRAPVVTDSSTTHYAYVYSNPFTERNFRVFEAVGQNAGGIVHTFRESVFMCVLRDIDSRAMRPIFVSKEYNVSPFEELYMPGRFIFWFSVRPFEYALTLAEEPAVVYGEDIDPNFEVEKHYLRMRKYTEMTGSNEIDPLCELVPERLNDLKNQRDRLCVAIAQSSYYNDWVYYPYRNRSDCVEEEVLFRNVKNNLELEKSYRERMICCHTVSIEYGLDVFFYISRAYMSNHVFVYELDPMLSGNVYLVNMWTNVKIVDEINSFDFVES